MIAAVGGGVGVSVVPSTHRNKAFLLCHFDVASVIVSYCVVGGGGKPTCRMNIAMTSPRR